MRAALFGVLIISIVQLVYLLSGGSFFNENPNLRALQASKYFWETGSLSNPEYYKLHEKLLEESKYSKLWQDLYSETSSGTLVPKLSIFFIVLASPVIGTLGLEGIIIVNLFQWFLIIFCLYNVFKEAGGRFPVLFLFCLFCGTQAWSHAFTFTLETNAVLLISLALYLTKKFPILAGIMAGLSAFHRPTNAISAIAVGFHSSRKLRTLIGAGIGLSFFATFNLLVWGDFLTTQYHRMPFYEFGSITYKSGVTSFELRNLLVEPLEKLFSSKHGIITYNILLLSILILRPNCMVLALNLLLQTLLIFTYSGYDPDGAGYNSSGGNRYLTCAILLVLPFLAASLEKYILNKYKNITTKLNHQN